MCSAMREYSSGKIIASPRHWDNVARQAVSEFKNPELWTSGQCEQGFLNARGEFLDRKEAFIVALVHGQIIRETPFTLRGKLDSEALY